jgi:hypothetical protein
MNSSVNPRLADVHPRMLRADSPLDPRKSGEDLRREIGQAFEWALDRARLTKQQAADGMGYSDSGVIGRWVSGLERVQLDKVRLLGDDVFQEFVIALAQTCGGVEVKTQITLSRVS